MKRTYRKYSNLVLLGAAELDAGNVVKAAYHYQQAMASAEQLIDETILLFDGDIRPLSLYSYAGCCLVDLHSRTGDSAAVRACLEQTGRKFLSILNNSGYPLPIRGKAIRAFEPLMNLAVTFFKSEGRPDEAYTVVGDWLMEVKRYVGRMRPVAETVSMN